MKRLPTQHGVENRKELGANMHSFLITILALTCFLSGCSRRERPDDLLRFVLCDHRLQTAHEVKAKTGGLREYVVEVFFRVEPAELKAVLPVASFQRDDAATRIVRTGNNSFAELSGVLFPSDALGFRRADLTRSDGKYCFLVCAPDYSFAYVIYVDSSAS